MSHKFKVGQYIVCGCENDCHWKGTILRVSKTDKNDYYEVRNRHGGIDLIKCINAKAPELRRGSVLECVEDHSNGVHKFKKGDKVTAMRIDKRMNGAFETKYMWCNLHYFNICKKIARNVPNV